MSDAAVERFVSRLSALRPTDRLSEQNLDIVRTLLARDIRDNTAALETDADELAALSAEIARLVGDTDTTSDGVLIERTPGLGLAIPFPGFPDPTYEPASTRALGTFLFDTGVTRTLSLSEVESLDQVGIEGSELPALLAPTGSLTPNGEDLDVAFEKGTLWIRIDLLAKNLPEGAKKRFVAFPVSATEGRFRATARGRRLVAPVEGRITIRLSFTAEPLKVCPGVVMTAPQEIALFWNGNGDVSVQLSSGSVNFDGNPIVFEGTDDTAYDADHQRMVFGAKAAPGTVETSTLSHRFAQLEGTLTVDRAGWTLPVVSLTPAGGLMTLAPLGSWAMWLTGEAVGTWDGLEGQLRFGDPWLEIATDGWRLEGKARTSSPDFDLDCWPLDGGYQQVALRLMERGRAALGCDQVNGDFIAFSAHLGAVLSQPVDISGAHLQLEDTDVSALLTEAEGIPRRIAIRNIGTVRGPSSQFCIENALIAARNIAFAQLEGLLTAPRRVESGRLRLEMEAFQWLPILPDPYVSNVETRLFRHRPIALVTEVVWTETDLSVVLSGGLDSSALELLSPSPRISVPTDIASERVRRDGQTMSGRQTRSKEAQNNWRKAIAFTENFEGAGVSRQGEGIWNEVVQEFDEARVRLLDVSTRRHQIGVALNIASRAGAAPIRVSGLHVLTELSDVQVFALPQIQWEPVRTLDVDQNIDPMTLLGAFPTPLASPDDGGATRITSNTATLAPAIPDLMVDAMVSAFEGGVPMRMVTTLPFGLRALMELRPEGDVIQRADRVRRVEPSFEEPEPLQGGLQLAIEAGETNVRQPTADPGFQGWAFQQPNGVDLETGAPRNISVLGSTDAPDASVEALFNTEFLFSRPKVPLTRLDISGYGASSFSDWRNPFAAFAEAAKVEFQVLVGRTALEIVKFVSVLYPWGIRVTRSVTIERGTGAGVLRRDSGWQPTSDGLLDFRYVPEGKTDPEPSPYTIHPGLIRGLFEIRRIRPADRGRIELTNGGAVQPMLFDAEVELGTSEARSVRTRATGILGYLHLEPVGAPITPEDLEELLDVMGPAGGPIDVALEIDTSGLACRLSRMEIAIAISPTSGGSALAGAIIGLPKFGTGGSWSVAAFPGPGVLDEPPEATVVDEGVSIIRLGLAGPPSSGRIDVPTPDPMIRFADAADLFRPTAPERDYAFLQVTSTHSFAYRRPFIKSGSTTIHAGLPALFADVLVRTAGSSLFPPEEMAITLPSAVELVVDSTAKVPRLNAPVNLPVTRGPVTVADSDVGGGKLDYGGTTLALDIGTDYWSVMMPGLEIQNSILSIDGISGLRFDLIGGSTVEDRLDNIKSLLGGFFGDVFEAIPGLGPETDIPPYALQATNLKHKVKFKILQKHGGKIAKTLKLVGTVRTEFGYEELSVPKDKLPPGAEDLKLEVGQAIFGTGIGFELRGEIPVGGGWILVVGVAWDLGYQAGFGTDVPGGGKIAPKIKAIANTRVEAGAGYGGGLGPFKATGYLIGIFLYTIQGQAIGFGLGIRWEFEAKILIVCVNAYMEALGILLLEPPKKFLIGQAEVGINVKVAMFFSIKFSLTVSVKGEI